MEWVGLALGLLPEIMQFIEKIGTNYSYF